MPPTGFPGGYPQTTARDYYYGAAAPPPKRHRTSIDYGRGIEADSRMARPMDTYGRPMEAYGQPTMYGQPGAYPAPMQSYQTGQVVADYGVRGFNIWVDQLLTLARCPMACNHQPL